MTNKAQTEKELFDMFNAENDSGFKTEDLIKIYKAHIDDDWDALNIDEVLAELDYLDSLDSNK